jgi:hypothetical protein
MLWQLVWGPSWCVVSGRKAPRPAESGRRTAGIAGHRRDSPVGAHQRTSAKCQRVVSCLDTQDTIARAQGQGCGSAAMFADTETRSESLEQSWRRLRAAGLAVALAAGLLAAGLAGASSASASAATMVTQSAKGGVLKDGRLTLRGVSGRVTYVLNPGRRGTLSVRRLHRRLFLPGGPRRARCTWRATAAGTSRASGSAGRATTPPATRSATGPSGSTTSRCPGGPPARPEPPSAGSAPPRCQSSPTRG